MILVCSLHWIIVPVFGAFKTINILIGFKNQALRYYLGLHYKFRNSTWISDIYDLFNELNMLDNFEHRLEVNINQT